MRPVADGSACIGAASALDRLGEAGDVDPRLAVEVRDGPLDDLVTPDVRKVYVERHGGRGLGRFSGGQLLGLRHGFPS